MIAVECYADTCLVKTLGAVGASVLHAQGKGKVLALLRSGKASLGLVDEDPGAVEYPEIRNYLPLEARGSLRLLRHKQEVQKRLIVVCPRLEEWMLGRAKQAQINPTDYGLMRDPRQLHAKGRYDRNPKFRAFLERLADMDEEVKKLREWIS